MGRLRRSLSRRDFLKAAGVTGALSVSGSLLGAQAAQGHDGSHGGGQDAAGGGRNSPKASERMEDMHFGFGGKGDVDLSRFNPTEFLRATTRY